MWARVAYYTHTDISFHLVPKLVPQMQVKHGLGVDEIANQVLQAWEQATGKKRR